MRLTRYGEAVNAARDESRRNRYLAALSELDGDTVYAAYHTRVADVIDGILEYCDPPLWHRPTRLTIVIKRRHSPPL